MPQVAGRLVACGFFQVDVGELACKSCTLDKPAPAFAATVLARDLTPGRKRAIIGPVSQRPSPRLTLQFPRWRRSIHGSRPAHRVPHSQASRRALPDAGFARGLAVTGRGAAAYLTGQQLPGRSRANEGQAAITRPVRDGSATATLAARLATLPATSSVHGSVAPRRPAIDSASSVADAATIISSTDSGVSDATHPGCPCDATNRCM
jgi:hypothetical protein